VSSERWVLLRPADQGRLRHLQRLDQRDVPVTFQRPWTLVEEATRVNRAPRHANRPTVEREVEYASGEESSWSDHRVRGAGFCRSDRLHPGP